VKIGSDILNVYLYSSTNYGGTSITLASDTNYSALGTQNFNDMMESLIIVPVVASGCVTLYSDCYYIAPSSTYCSSTTQIDRNDFYSSLVVGAGIQVTVYQNASYGGSSVSFGINNSIYQVNCLTTYNMNDSISSLKILTTTPDSGCMLTYDDCGYSGTATEYCSSTSGLGGTISSVVVGASVSGVILYSGSSYSGNTLSISANTSYSCLTSANFNDLTKSIAIAADPGAGCVTLWSDCWFGSDSITYCSNQSTVAKNDYYSSMAVGSGHTVTLYKDSNYGGTSHSYSTGVQACLTTTSFNDSLSSLKIN